MKRFFALFALLFAATLCYAAGPASAASLAPNQLAQAPTPSAVVKVGGYDGSDNGYRRYDDQDDRAYTDDKSFRDPKDFSDDRSYRDPKDFSDERTYRAPPQRDDSYRPTYPRYGGGYDGPRYREYGYRDYCWSCRHRCHDGYCPPRCWGWWRQCRGDRW